MELVDVRDQEMITHLRQVLQDQGLPQQTRHQPHKHTGDGGGQGRKVFKSALLGRGEGRGDTACGICIDPYNTFYWYRKWSFLRHCT